MERFATARLPVHPGATAPGGTDVRTLLQLKQGSFAHFTLAPGRASFAVALNRPGFPGNCNQSVAGTV